MYCNQCGYKMKDSANFCRRCGAPADDTQGDISETRQKIIKFLYTYKTGILFSLIGILLLAGVIVGTVTIIQAAGEKQKEEQQAAIPVKQVSGVDLKEAYEIEDNWLILDPLHASYTDETVHELQDYAIYIDAVQYKRTEKGIKVKDLYDGKHLVRLEWKQAGNLMKYEKTIYMEHKKDTWEKYVDLVGMTGKEIADAYGSLGEPEFGSWDNGNLGYAYVTVNSLGLQACFPTGILKKEKKFSKSDVRCVEMTGTLNTLFYNLEVEMNLEDLANILGITLTASEGGGCSGTLSDGKQILIGQGEVQDGIYRPDTTVIVTVSEEDRKGFFERLF